MIPFDQRRFEAFPSPTTTQRRACLLRLANAADGRRYVILSIEQQVARFVRFSAKGHETTSVPWREDFAGALTVIGRDRDWEWKCLALGWGAKGGDRCGDGGDLGVGFPTLV